MDKDFFLYQYTSLETLALILENKTIRLRKLSLLDDPLEKYVGVISFTDRGPKVKREDLGGFCFVSCWTKNEEESIAMWDMYGDRKQGVRIGLPSKMFDKHYSLYGTRKKQKLLFAYPEMYFPVPQLVEIDYRRIDDPLIYDKEFRLSLDSLGKYKLPDWEFQKEIRYRLFASNEVNHKGNVYFGSPDFMKINQLQFNHPISRNFIDFKLDESVIAKLKIIVGPNISAGDRLLFDALVEKYNIDTDRICNSKYTDAWSSVKI